MADIITLCIFLYVMAGAALMIAVAERNPCATPLALFVALVFGPVIFAAGVVLGLASLAANWLSRQG